jgi:hypothetical protein
VTEFLSLLLVIVGFGYLFIAAAKLGSGPHDAFDALFASPMPPAWRPAERPAPLGLLALALSATQVSRA